MHIKDGNDLLKQDIQRCHDNMNHLINRLTKLEQKNNNTYYCSCSICSAILNSQKMPAHHK